MHKRHFVTLLVSILLVAICICGSAYTYVKLKQPESGIVSVGRPLSSGLTDQIDLTPKCLTGTYVSFCYPKGLSAQQTQPLHYPAVQTALFSARDIQSWLLSIEVDTGSGQLSSSSAYTLRSDNRAQYEESHLVVDGWLVDVMKDTKASGFSEVAFLTSGDSIATISLVGDDPTGASLLNSAFMMVLNSWHWQ